MADQVMVFVDAGYIWHTMATVHGVSSLEQLVVSYEELATLLRTRIEEAVGPVLRIRWYDAADPARRITNPRALGMSAVPGVRLVEGRLVHRNGVLTQKAVDTRLVADMVTIAHQRQVDRFVLLSGDEDMVPGVEAAEDLGLHVEVWSIEAPDSAPTVSRELVTLTDSHRTINLDELRPLITPAGQIVQAIAHATQTATPEAPTADTAPEPPATAPTSPEPAPAAPPSPVPSPAVIAKTARHLPRPMPQPGQTTEPPLPNLWGIDQAAYHRAVETEGNITDRQLATLVGTTYARRWWRAVDEQAHARIHRLNPRNGAFDMVPKEIDKDLLRFAEDNGLNTWGSVWVKTLVRNGWWDALDELASAEQ
ncbi:NYN domain-containing protein [Luteococcus sp.]|uniref:NYN domain-containing protein n=1 Tax=Luteococcus sp. TaxID=1969402 RepID=UPI0037356976